MRLFQKPLRVLWARSTNPPLLPTQPPMVPEHDRWLGGGEAANAIGSREWPNGWGAEPKIRVTDFVTGKKSRRKSAPADFVTGKDSSAPERYPMRQGKTQSRWGSGSNRIGQTPNPPHAPA